MKPNSKLAPVEKCAINHISTAWASAIVEAVSVDLCGVARRA